MNLNKKAISAVLLSGFAAFDLFLVLGIITFYSPSILPNYGNAFSDAYRGILEALGGSLFSDVLFQTVFYSWVWGAFILVIFYTLMRNKKSILMAIKGKLSLSDHDGNSFISKQGTALLLLYGVFMAILLYSYRFTQYFVPQGFDTPTYMYLTQIWRQNFFYGFTSASYTRPLFLLMLYGLSFGFGRSLELLFIFLPIFLAIIYSLAVYFFVKSTTGNGLLALLSLGLSVESYFVIRMSYDLYSNFFYMSVMVIFLSLVVRSMSDRRTTYVLLSITFSFVALSVHPWTWLVTLLTLGLFSVMKLIDAGRAYVKNLSILVLILLPSTVATAGLIIANPGLLFLYAVKWFNLPDNWYWFAGNESAILLFFALVGLLISLSRKDNYHRLLLSWVFSISILVLVTGYDQPYRFCILLPLGLLAAQGVYSTFRLIYSAMQGKTGLHYVKYIKAATLLALVLPIGYSALTTAYIAPYVYYPDQATMSQLHFIEGHFSFSNSAIIVPIFDPLVQSIRGSGDVNLHDWVRAEVGDVAYYGHLLDLVGGKPDSYMNVFDYRNKSIILASRLYHITALERNIGQQIADGIYEINNITLAKVLQAINMTSAYFDYGLADWQIMNTTAQTLVYSTTNGLEIQFKRTITPDELSVRFRETSLKQIDLFISKNVSSNGITLSDSSDIILRMQVNLGFVQTTIGIFGHDPRNSSIHFSGRIEPYLANSAQFNWVVIPVHDGWGLDQIYVRFNSAQYFLPELEMVNIQSIYII